MKIYCASIFAITASSTWATVVPLHSDAQGNSLVELQGGLGLHRVQFVPWGTSYGVTQSQGLGPYISLLAEDGQTSFNCFTHCFHSFNPQPHPNYNGTIGIGPGSDLQHAARSISVITDDNHGRSLILGLTERDFKQRYCDQEAVAIIPLFPGRMGSPSHILWAPRGIINMNGNSYRVQATISHLNPDKLIEVPRGLLRNLSDEVRSILERQEHTVRFSDCRRMVSHFPQFEIEFSGSDEEHEPVGRLSLSPEDYVKNVGEDTCELLMRTLHFPLLSLNPLLLPNTNIFTKTTKLILCDPRDHN